MRRYLLAAWLLYFLFVIYGSLVPLQFRSRPLADAWQTFRQIPYLQLGIASRADWVANLLLFIPLAFLSLAAFFPSRKLIPRFIGSLVVLAACVGLSVGIEFAQIFFPPRTVSLNDIIAESIGGFLGVLGWWIFGSRIIDWLGRWKRAEQQRGLWSLCLQLYVSILILYNVMPLDLSLSPVEIYHKWKAGRLILVPFGFHFATPVQMFYGIGTDIAIWVPVGVMMILAGKRGPIVWIVTVGSASALEFLQLFVYSRVTDVTQIILAAVGASVGVWISARLKFLKNDSLSADSYVQLTFHSGHGRMLAWITVLFVWTLLLVAVFWYPYDFNFERAFLVERVNRLLSEVPFHAYYYGTEFRALTEVFHKTLFFIPLGGIIAMAWLSAPTLRWYRFVGFAVATVLISTVASGIDLGRLMLPAKRVDIADWFLQVGGGLVGYWAACAIARPTVEVPAEATNRDTVRS